MVRTGLKTETFSATLARKRRSNQLSHKNVLCNFLEQHLISLPEDQTYGTFELNDNNELLLKAWLKGWVKTTEKFGFWVLKKLFRRYLKTKSSKSVKIMYFYRWVYCFVATSSSFSIPPPPPIKSPKIRGTIPITIQSCINHFNAPIVLGRFYYCKTRPIYFLQNPCWKTCSGPNHSAYWRTHTLSVISQNNWNL